MVRGGIPMAPIHLFCWDRRKVSNVCNSQENSLSWLIDIILGSMGPKSNSKRFKHIIACETRSPETQTISPGLCLSLFLSELAILGEWWWGGALFPGMRWPQHASYPLNNCSRKCPIWIEVQHQLWLSEVWVMYLDLSLLFVQMSGIYLLLEMGSGDWL